MKFSNYDQLAEVVKQNRGVITCKMGKLRDAYGAGKLGVNVVENIHDELHKRGLSYIPEKLPLSQFNSVRIYSRSSRVGKLIHAALDVDNDGSEQILLEIATSEIADNKAADILLKIRELVCD